MICDVSLSSKVIQCESLPAIPHLTWIINGSQLKEYTNENTYMSTVEAHCDNTHYLDNSSMSPFYCTFDEVWSVNVSEFRCLCK